MDTCCLMVNDAWSRLGPSASRTEAPTNSAQSQLWWTATVSGALVVIYIAQQATALAQKPGPAAVNLVNPGSRCIRGAAGTGLVALSNVLLPVGVGFVFGSMATLQRLWF